LAGDLRVRAAGLARLRCPARPWLLAAVPTQRALHGPAGWTGPARRAALQVAGGRPAGRSLGCQRRGSLLALDKLLRVVARQQPVLAAPAAGGSTAGGAGVRWRQRRVGAAAPAAAEPCEPRHRAGAQAPLTSAWPSRSLVSAPAARCRTCAWGRSAGQAGAEGSSVRRAGPGLLRAPPARAASCSRGAARCGQPCRPRR
jgi:hypothetical protein